VSPERRTSGHRVRANDSNDTPQAGGGGAGGEITTRGKEILEAKLKRKEGEVGKLTRRPGVIDPTSWGGAYPRVKIWTGPTCLGKSVQPRAAQA